MWTVSWQIKASKWCNLRCLYCYEWNELSQRERIAVDDWKRILVAIKRYHDSQTERFEEVGQTVIVWHGGEPLTLPQSYWEEVVGLSRKILGEENLSRRFTYVVQTNLYTLTPGMLDLLQREEFRVGVSLDTAPGVRVTIKGSQTEHQVIANIDRLVERGILLTCHVVLGGHTKTRLREIHDFFAERGIAFGLTPLFDAPMLTSHANLAITHEETAEAFEDLFVHWMENSCRVKVFNLNCYLNTVLLHMASLERLAWDARQNGERVFVVNTDGTLSSVVERYRPQRSLGNLFRQSLDEIIESPAYIASCERREQLVQRHCHECRFHGACDGEPLFTIPHGYAPGPCPVASRVCHFIENYVRRAGYDEHQVLAHMPRAAMSVAAL